METFIPFTDVYIFAYKYVNPWSWIIQTSEIRNSTVKGKSNKGTLNASVHGAVNLYICAIFLRCKYIQICYILEIVFHKTRSSDDISIQKYKGFTKHMYLLRMITVIKSLALPISIQRLTVLSISP